MFGKKKQRILFFILGPVATAAQIEAAESLGACFRNALGMGEHDAIEKADAVCGAVPAVYLQRKTRVIELAPGVMGEAVAAVAAPAAPVPVATVEELAKTDPIVPQAPLDPEAAAKAEQREREDAGAKRATAAQLKEALTQLNILFASNTPKPALLALYLSRP